MVGDMQALFDHLRLAQVHLVGHSFGGRLILNYAIAHSARVLSLTLADAVVPAVFPASGLRSGRAWLLATRTGPVKHMHRLGRERSAADSLALLSDLAGELVRDVPDASKGAFLPFALWNARGGAGPQWHRLVQTTTALAELEADPGATSDELRTIRQPVLLLVGEWSRYRPISHALHGILSNSTFILIPKVGHFHPWLKPKVFADSFLTFLQSQPGPARA
jgi:pimeloyl-ACP methyl ester carboxylesterase